MTDRKNPKYKELVRSIKNVEYDINRYEKEIPKMKEKFDKDIEAPFDELIKHSPWSELFQKNPKKPYSDKYIKDTVTKYAGSVILEAKDTLNAYKSSKADLEQKLQSTPKRVSEQQLRKRSRSPDKRSKSPDKRRLSSPPRKSSLKRSSQPRSGPKKSVKWNADKYELYPMNPKTETLIYDEKPIRISSRSGEVTIGRSSWESFAKNEYIPRQAVKVSVDSETGDLTVTALRSTIKYYKKGTVTSLENGKTIELNDGDSVILLHPLLGFKIKSIKSAKLSY